MQFYYHLQSLRKTKNYVTYYYFGVSVLFIGVAGLTAYIPLVLILLILWYVVGHLL